MALPRRSSHYCLLVLTLLVHLTFSFSVEELCHKRCLYGRGGVLCNCNARHFTGKRSSLLEGENVYLTGSNTHERQSTFPQVDIQSEKHANILADTFLPGNDIHPQDYNMREPSHLDNSWHRQQFADILASLNDKSRSITDGSVAEEGTEKGDNTGTVQRKLTATLPMLYIEQSANNDKDDDDDYVKEAKEDVGSKLQQIIAGPLLKDGQAATFDHLNGDDEDADNDAETAPNSEMQRHQLIELQQVLKRALHGR